MMSAQVARPRGKREPGWRLSLAFVVASLALALGAAGCSVLGGDQPARTWYTLIDLNPAPAKAVAPGGKGLVLLISPTSESGFYDGTSIAFTRAGGGRGYYQFASWTERPAKRLAQLLESRLATSGGFGAVAQASAGVRGDLLLNLRLEEIHFDQSPPPGTAVVAVTAELLDWRARKIIARERFQRVATVEGGNPAVAAAGFNRAVTALLDELVGWLQERGSGLR